MDKFKLSRTNEYNNKLKQVLPGGVHYSFRMPWESHQIHLEEGKGTLAWDMDGNEYIDLFAKFGANILGHNDERYINSLTACLGNITATNLSNNELDAVSMICEFVPCAEMVRFSLSGTEAVQNAIRLARAYTKRNKFIRFWPHYHGSADNTMGGRVGDMSNPIPVEFPGDFYDTEGKADNILQEQSLLLPWNDLDILSEVLSQQHNEVSAIITEPICINGGGIMPVIGYLEGMRQLCDQYGVVLIFDEMITGFRVGIGGAQRMFNVTPDLATFGKAMAGGSLPVSAVAGKKEIMKLYENRRVAHGGTFNGYALGMAAVKSTLEILSENECSGYDKMCTHMKAICDVFLKEASANNIAFEIHTPSPCAVFTLAERETSCAPKETMIRQYLNKFVGQALVEYGILHSNSNRFYGNISMGQSDVDLFAERIKPVFASVQEFVEKLRN